MCSLLGYRNTTGFCVLISILQHYPTYLLVLGGFVFVSWGFFLDSLGFSIETMMSFADRHSFISSLPTSVPFISFYQLIALTRTFSTMLNKSGMSGHLCLVPHLQEKAFSLLPISMMFSVGFYRCSSSS